MTCRQLCAKRCEEQARLALATLTAQHTTWLTLSFSVTRAGQGVGLLPVQERVRDTAGADMSRRARKLVAVSRVRPARARDSVLITMNEFDEVC